MGIKTLNISMLVLVKKIAENILRKLRIREVGSVNQRRTLKVLLSSIMMTFSLLEMKLTWSLV
jgi:uncharacterized membrane protein